MKWTKRFIELADTVAQWSKDPSTKVGAVIVDSHNRIIGIGYNGFPRGVDDGDDRYADRKTKLKMVVHAEANAILNSNSSVEGCTIYTTHPPCCHCASLIIQSGINRVIYKKPSEDFMSRFKESFEVSKCMFGEAEISCYSIEDWS